MSGTAVQTKTNRTGNRHRLNTDPAFDLTQVFLALYNWRYFIILMTVLSAVFSFVLASARAPVYEATTTVLVDPRGIAVIERDINPRTESPEGNVAIIESQRRIMTSDPILREVIEKEGLHKDPEFNKNAAGVLSLVLGSRENKTTSMNKVLSRLRKASTTYRAQSSYIIELTVRSQDPEKAARIANTIANTYLSREAETRSRLARKAADSLNSRLDALRTQVTEAENAMEDYKLRNRIVSASGGLINEQELTQVNNTLVQARNITSAAKITLEAVKRLKASGNIPQSLPASIRSPAIARLRTQLAEATQQKNRLSAQYLDTHPLMKAETLRIQDIRKSINEELDRIAEAAEQEYRSAKQQEEALQAKVINLTNQSYSTNDSLVKLRDLERDAQAKRAVYEAFLIRAKEVGQQAEVDTDRASVVSPAFPPLDPAGMPKSILAAAGTMGGFALSCVFVLVITGVSSLNAAATAGQSIRSGRYSGRAANSNAKATTSAKRSIFGFKRFKTEQNRTALRLPVITGLRIGREFLIGNRIPVLSDSMYGREIERVAEAIASYRNRQRARVVLVTGLNESFSKSVFSCNLSYMLAQDSASSILVSADPMTEEAVTAFGDVVEHELRAGQLQAAAGAEYLTAGAEDGFLYMRAGIANGADSLSARARLHRLKEQLKCNNFDSAVAVIDAPLLDDTLPMEELARLADEVIVVLPEGIKSQHVDFSLFRKLGRKRERIRGVVTVDYA